MARPKSSHPTDVHVGTRVRMRRMMLSMSQEKLAEGLKLTFQQVQKYEKGTNRISASRLEQIAKILKVPIPFFFEGLDGTAAAVPTLNEFQVKMLMAVESVKNETRQNNILAMVRLLVSQQ